MEGGGGGGGKGDSGSGKRSKGRLRAASTNKSIGRTRRQRKLEKGGTEERGEVMIANGKKRSIRR